MTHELMWEETSMADETLTADGVAAMAASSGVVLDEAAAARVARTVGPTAARFAQPDIAVPFETEPATFLVVARKGARR